jgi:transcriptional regulator with XRE-family HTH domain
VSWWKNPKRSKFGRFLDKNGITQAEFAKKSHISKTTISTLCNAKNYSPSPKVLKRVMDTIKKIDKNKQPNDFFNI